MCEIEHLNYIRPNFPQLSVSCVSCEGHHRLETSLTQGYTCPHRHVLQTKVAKLTLTVKPYVLCTSTTGWLILSNRNTQQHQCCIMRLNVNHRAVLQWGKRLDTYRLLEYFYILWRRFLSCLHMPGIQQKHRLSRNIRWMDEYHDEQKLGRFIDGESGLDSHMHE